MATAGDDPNAWHEAFRNAIAPMICIQEGLKTAQRLARLQRTITDDRIASGFAQMHAAFESKSLAEFFEKERAPRGRGGPGAREVVSDSRFVAAAEKQEHCAKSTESAGKA